ncbi:hypothetical protein B9Z55_000189 [Caenorhabditis nigoni]|uniref:DUF38 domain-containing protein n=1 Tax=Caenorhabditis nigoni TaxID=1611254 RepID=A0A2G5VI47_9PELO|nr:hypothetical protein B9Z55_000189 [Caenorhabditis nigoni]
MESKPMAFCDTKTVLMYMEPSWRFHIALKIPSLRKAEKATPLIINRLELYDNRLIVNDTEYQMRVYRQCQADAGLYNGEVDDDSDEYGFIISYAESIQPGDMLLTDEGRKRRRRGCTLEDLQYDCPARLNSLPCNHYIRLYVFGSMSQFPYTNMKMYHLTRRLLTIFFGNRVESWIIKNLNLKDKVLRWPKDGKKPIVQNVKFGHYNTYKMNALLSIIDSSVPLASLKTFGRIEVEDYPLFRFVEHLMIPHFTYYNYNTALLDLFSIEASHVSLTTPTTLIDGYLEKLILKLMKELRPIGVRYSILVKEKMDLTKIEHTKLLEADRDCIKLEMGDDAVVVVQYAYTDKKTWLNIEIVPKPNKKHRISSNRSPWASIRGPPF